MYLTPREALENPAGELQSRGPWDSIGGHQEMRNRGDGQEGESWALGLDESRGLGAKRRRERGPKQHDPGVGRSRDQDLEARAAGARGTGLGAAGGPGGAAHARGRVARPAAGCVSVPGRRVREESGGCCRHGAEGGEALSRLVVLGHEQP